MTSPELPVQAWDDVRYFLAVAETGSLNAAAKSLGIVHTTVGRRIRAMEDRYGAELFVRRGNAMQITQDGMLALEDARTMAAAASGFARRLGNAVGRPEGEVRIGGAEGICNYWLMPNLHPFLNERPKLRVNWVLTNRIDISLGADFDIGLSWHQLKEPYAVVSRLGSCRYSLFTTQAYIDAHGAPQSIAEFGKHRFLHFNGYEDNPGLKKWNSLMARHGNAMKLDSTSASSAALRSGAVITLLPDYAAQADASLVRLPLEMGISLDVFLAFHEDKRETARVRVIVDEIRRLFASAKGVWFS